LWGFGFILRRFCTVCANLSDMPQPLSRVRSNVSYQSGHATIEKIPELAPIILQCISAVAEADRSKGLILACMLGNDAHIGLRMYMALPSARAKESALAAAADAYLPHEDRAVLSAIKKAAKAAFDERNSFAHCCWGYTEDLPDAALMIPGGEIGTLVNKASAPHAFALAGLVPSSKVMVYRKNDLQAALQRASRALRLYSTFYGELFHRRHSDRLPLEHGIVAKVQQEVDAKHAEQYAQLKIELHIS